MRFSLTRAVWARTIQGILPFLGAIVMGAQAVCAQSSDPETLEIGPSGEAYLATLARGIDTNVAYFDPTRAAPELSTDVQPQREAREPFRVADFDIARWQVNLVVALILIALIVFVAKNAGSISILSRRVGDADSASAANAPARPHGRPELPKSLSTILANTNRREAIVQLARAVLARVANANGLLLQRSWTARDTLRRIPNEQSHLAAIRDLVLTSERVQFGGYPISEDEFKAHVDAAGPLFVEGARA